MFLVVPIVALVIAASVGDALTTTWAERHPLPLTLLNARNRVLVLTTNQLDPWSFYLAAGARLLASDPLFYLLGRWHGEAALQWVDRKSQTMGEQVRLFEKAFAKAAYPLVVVAPNNLVCLFAGAAGMPVRLFFVLNVVGTAGRLYLIRRLGETFEAPIQDVLGFFARYRWPLLAISVAAVALMLWRDRAQKKGELGAVLDLGHELPDDPDEDSPPPNR